MAYTTADLISNIKRRSFLPVAQTQFTDQQLLDIGNDAVLSTVAPMLRRMDQGYWLESYDQALTADQASYAFPRHAMWNKFNVAQLVDDEGVVVAQLTRTDPHGMQWSASNDSGQPSKFYFTHDKVVVHPAPTSTVASDLSLRMWIYRRPNRMVTEDAAAVVSTAAGALVTYTAAKPATFTATSVHDFFSHRSPFVRLGTSKVATASAAPTTQGYATADVALLSAGNWVCLEDETVFPPLPIEMVPHLESLIILELASTQMDRDAYAAKRAEIVGEVEGILKGASNRADAQPKTVSLLNSPVAQMLGRRGRKMVRS